MTVEELLVHLDETPNAMMRLMSCALALRAIKATDKKSAKVARACLQKLMSQKCQTEGLNPSGALYEINRITDDQLAGFIDGVVATVFLMKSVRDGGQLIDEGLLGKSMTSGIEQGRPSLN